MSAVKCLTGFEDKEGTATQDTNTELTTNITAGKVTVPFSSERISAKRLGLAQTRTMKPDTDSLRWDREVHNLTNIP